MFNQLQSSFRPSKTLFVSKTLYVLGSFPHDPLPNCSLRAKHTAQTCYSEFQKGRNMTYQYIDNCLSDLLLRCPIRHRFFPLANVKPRRPAGAEVNVLRMRRAEEEPRNQAQ